MHWLEHEVVFFVGSDRFHEPSAGRCWAQTIIHEPGCVGSPLAEVVVHIDGGDTRVPRAFLQSANLRATGKACRRRRSPSGNSKWLMTSMSNNAMDDLFRLFRLVMGRVNRVCLTH